MKTKCGVTNLVCNKTSPHPSGVNAIQLFFLSFSPCKSIMKLILTSLFTPRSMILNTIDNWILNKKRCASWVPTKAQLTYTDFTHESSPPRTGTVEYGVKPCRRRYWRKAELCVLAVPDVLATEDSNCSWEELSKRRGNLRATGGKRIGTLQTLHHFSRNDFRY